jgi:hypothetical protein
MMLSSASLQNCQGIISLKMLTELLGNASFLSKFSELPGTNFSSNMLTELQGNDSFLSKFTELPGNNSSSTYGIARQ